MIQIRQSMFETNSSSADVFCIPSSPSLKIPKEIKMSRLYVDTYSLDKNASVEDKLSFMYNRAEEAGCAAEFIKYLTYIGINVINDVGDLFEYNPYMFGYNMEQKDLDAFLFDSNSICLDTPTYDEYKNISKDFTVLDFHR